MQQDRGLKLQHVIVYQELAEWYTLGRNWLSEIFFLAKTLVLI